MILEVNLFAFTYRLFHEDFSSIIGLLHDTIFQISDTIETLTDQLKCIYSSSVLYDLTATKSIASAFLFDTLRI